MKHAALLLIAFLFIVPACQAQTDQDSVINGTRCFGHGGGAPGMNGMLQICPASGYVIAVLANLDPPAASRV